MEKLAARRYFGTDGIRGEVGQYPITPEFVLKLGWAIGKVLSHGERGKVLIGKDTRISGYMFESALEAGLAAAGVDIHLLGPMPTPAIAYLTKTQRASAGIVISASHNLYQDNGIKIFSNKGYKLDDDVELQIENMLDQPMVTVKSEELGRAVRIDDAPGRYIEYCKSTVSSQISFDNLKVVVDAANGATYHIAANVLRELGAKVVSIASEPSGYNINLNCGSTKPQALQQKVIEEKADLGIALDGDGDRLVMVDHNGETLDGDELLYLIVKFRQDTNIFKGGVVGTLMTNIGLEKAFQRENIPFERAQVGDRYVLEILLKNDWTVGGEQSGHIICLDNATTGDGIISALQVLSAVKHYGKPLAELKSGFSKFPQKLVNIRLKNEKDPLQHAHVQTAIADAKKTLGDRGRILVRKSGTEPLIRIMVEADDEALMHQLTNRLFEVISELSS
ncbi:MAG: phosphoglucosamine mutase [Gammaproteobacteria bacterium]|nr:phosphoglucosamine mutase [Gammaproteobacteria bacterium]